MQQKINILNKKAKFQYEILDRYTAGIVLSGTEIKSIRSSRASIAESFCEFNDKGELFVINMTIEEYAFGNYYNHAPKATRKLLLNKRELKKLEKEVNINSKNLPDFLGVPKFKSGELESENRVGIVTGLAWTEYGGEILKIETVTMPGKGRMQITGKLGDVMQESVKAAKSFVRSKCLEYGIIPPLFEKKDFHIHGPEGATPKDGPSAGIGMVTSIVSSITNIPVKRDVAMTGEVTLTGQVLPIGGLKEKLLAAHRAGIKEVLIPKENEKDLVDMNKKIIIENDNIESKCGWSPFNGFEFKGTPVSTIIAGKIKMKDGEILGDPDGTPLEFN